MPILLPYLLDHFTVAVAAVGGVLAARGKQVDLFGVVVLALVTALGGGTVRDWSLGHLPVLWIRDSNFLLTGLAAGILTFFLAARWEPPRRLLLIADAIALSIGTVAGASKAVAFHTGPTAAIALGVVTGVVGGVIRDVILGEIPLVFRKETHFYATASLCGAAVFVLLAPFSPEAAALGSAGTTLLIRLVSLRWKLGLPTFTPKQP